MFGLSLKFQRTIRFIKKKQKKPTRTNSSDILKLIRTPDKFEHVKRLKTKNVSDVYLRIFILPNLSTEKYTRIL